METQQEPDTPEDSSCPRTWDPGNPEHNMFLREYQVYTDGSGHKDGLGGAAYCLRTPGPQFVQRVFASSRTSTARMEFEAILQALQEIVEHSGILKDSRRGKPSVWWVSDRQDLVLSCARLQGRDANPDLWHRYTWYEGILDIHPFYQGRAQTAMNRLADTLAGEGRGMMKKLREKGFIQ